MILVGRGTLEADAPKLDVRLTGLEDRSPRRAVLTGGKAANGWESLKSPGDIAALDKVDHLLVEGGAATAAAFLRSEEHTSELQSLMRISYAVFCLKKKNSQQQTTHI